MSHPRTTAGSPDQHDEVTAAVPSRGGLTRDVSLDLALQGGGSHGAFTWGVLDRLLDEDRLRFDGVSGTSAGAVNAVALASGLVEGGRPGAQAALRRVWEAVGRLGSWVAEPHLALVAGTPLEPWARAADQWRAHWADTLGPVGQAAEGLARAWAAAWSQLSSPYQTNPLGLHPLEPVLATAIDFEAVRRCESVRLFVAATQVRSGQLRLFGCAEITPEVVLASACLPTLFQAVTIDGEDYWDGGYAGNPALLPLLAQTAADDLLIVQINPIRREEPPRTAVEILDRMNEITFNATLLKDLRALALLSRVAADVPAGSGGPPLLDRVRALRAHRLDGADALASLGAGAKTTATTSLLEELHALGHARADAWLTRHGADLGVRPTLELSGYLEIDL